MRQLFGRLGCRAASAVATTCNEMTTQVGVLSDNVGAAPGVKSGLPP